jgi:glutamate-1-semialdehyde 2,1-aminomutase
MANTYRKSIEWLEYARRWTPAAAQTMSKAPERFPVGAYPAFAAYGIDARLYDIDGNSFVDWICGLASITLGYRNEKVSKAITEQLSSGVNFSLPTKLEAKVVC